MNLADVRTSLHIPAEAPAWEFCSSTLNYNESEVGSYDIYKAMLGKYRILKYSGDADGVVPTYGT